MTTIHRSTATTCLPPPADAAAPTVTPRTPELLVLPPAPTARPKPPTTALALPKPREGQMGRGFGDLITDTALAVKMTERKNEPVDLMQPDQAIINAPQSDLNPTNGVDLDGFCVATCMRNLLLLSAASQKSPEGAAVPAEALAKKASELGLSVAAKTLTEFAAAARAGTVTEGMLHDVDAAIWATGNMLDVVNKKTDAIEPMIYDSSSKTLMLTAFGATTLPLDIRGVSWNVSLFNTGEHCVLADGRTLLADPTPFSLTNGALTGNAYYYYGRNAPEFTLPAAGYAIL